MAVLGPDAKAWIPSRGRRCAPSMMKITLWTKPGCVQCETTKREFDKRGIIYTTRWLNKSPKAVERFIELGLTAAPIVETDKKRWSGFRLGKIQSLESHLKTERMRGVNVPLQPMKQIADEVEDE
jgi:glutaredoxin-like protein NrdH